MYWILHASSSNGIEMSSFAEETNQKSLEHSAQRMGKEALQWGKQQQLGSARTQAFFAFVLLGVCDCW